ncbi:MAG: hypothetical protein CO023_02430 [Flavobacteriales bacterium CG_4_9_14_0_2_um_filter_35_242]|nr:MAG: hypothetical protein AUJ53_08235 [Flavobacteriaceae bacterium CG1_02_35_72]PIR12433.1 MAG: hypothetical protein COV50_09000 [Flavobacteriales bacterium CG11_big_fil_rev_8_21_14_0_20_35_7]PIV17044.1 MAG: hypothetical protein COS42_06805 [Flavobacteriales bacterium CG03_land_8_20_14_0_80_35_15]PIX05692.1 MAG: hypothetical protein COZ76_12885 [Flavobacteriales bacterium CG_4_8_14_3_um_filter_35_10]PJA05351.1 MAG: hypothetical protein COX71_07145 [Flavobacteriales bacterium CG_4_10_14_0_2_u
MEGFLKTIDLLEVKLLGVLKNYQELKETNQKLNATNQRLLDELSNQNQQNSDLEDRLQALKIANTMVGSKEDKLITKQKINSLIRDIDKCIALVNE